MHHTAQQHALTRDIVVRIFFPEQSQSPGVSLPTMARHTKAQLADMAEAREYLLALVKPGMTIYTTLEHRSRSGMHRRIGLHIIHEGDIRTITSLVARACDVRLGRDGAMHADGCGLDVGYHAVYSLGQVLFPGGGDARDSVRHVRDAKREDNGGYLLNHRWL